MPRKDQGVLHGRYQVIPRTLIFLFRQNQVLLIKGSPTKRLWANRYNGIGGHVERGEDILSAARRELFEETGLSPAALSLCGTVMIDVGESAGIALYVFRGDYGCGEIVSSEEGNLEWVELGRVYDLPLVEDLPVLLRMVLDTPAGVSPFAARYEYDDQERLRIHFG
jgi:8-oxo-dGTP diphosphatase